MRVAAVFLVEGVLLSNWLLLEFDKRATPEIKARYGLSALLMYGALLAADCRILWRVYVVYERWPHCEFY